MSKPYFYWIDGVRYFMPSSGRPRRAQVQLRSRHDRDDVLTPGPAKTITRPYYIGSAEMIGAREQKRLKTADGEPVTSVSPRWSKETIQEAVKEAEQRLLDNPRLMEVSVVKIVRVVRRAKPVVAVDIEVVE